jgi:Ran GTPase-activating protein (RanGAP) involved in mRNA processing and transport
LNIDECDPYINGKYIKTKVEILEINKCNIGKILSNKLISSLKTNREIQEIRLSSFGFNRGMVENLSDFIVNNYNLKKVNLSWSEFVCEDLLLLLSRIKPVKHLQDINISTIPIEGPA